VPSRGGALRHLDQGRVLRRKGRPVHFPPFPLHHPQDQDPSHRKSEAQATCTRSGGEGIFNPFQRGLWKCLFKNFINRETVRGFYSIAPDAEIAAKKGMVLVEGKDKKKRNLRSHKIRKKAKCKKRIVESAEREEREGLRAARGPEAPEEE